MNQEYDGLPDTSLFSIDTKSTDLEDAWIINMTLFLSTGLPPDHLTLDAKKRLVVQSRNFCLLSNTVYDKGLDDIWRCTVRQFEKDVVLRDVYQGITGGHYAGHITTRKIWAERVMVVDYEKRRA